MLIFAFLSSFAENQNVIYVPSIRNHEELSTHVQTELALASKGRPIYVLTAENFLLYTQKENIAPEELIEESPLIQAQKLKAQHLIIFSYTPQEHSIEALIYRIELAQPQVRIRKTYQSKNELISSLPALSQELISYTLLEEGLEDPLAYPMIAVPSGHDPHHNIHMSHGFLIGQHEVSQGLFMAIMHKNPVYNPDCDAQPPKRSLALPVSCVTFYDAIDFANRYSKQKGKESCYHYDATRKLHIKKDCLGCRLPSAQEWLYAASFSANTRYAGSNNPDDVAWTQENSSERVHPPQKKHPNAIGIFDLSGNVAEWTQTQSKTNYIVMGGSFRLPSEHAALQHRDVFSPSFLMDDQGFRIICSP